MWRESALGLEGMQLGSDDVLMELADEHREMGTIIALSLMIVVEEAKPLAVI